jgi:hypothetical protein
MIVYSEAHPFPVSAGSPSIGQAACSEKALIRAFAEGGALADPPVELPDTQHAVFIFF